MEKINIKKEILIGFLVGVLATAFGCFIFIEFFSMFDFYKSLDLIKEGSLEGKVLVLGALANFFVFFTFLTTLLFFEFQFGSKNKIKNALTKMVVISILNIMF